MAITADALRRLDPQLDPVLAVELAYTATQARTDPDHGRQLIALLYQEGVKRRPLATVLQLFVQGMWMRFVTERAEHDDAYALECAQLIGDLLEQSAPSGAAQP